MEALFSVQAIVPFFTLFALELVLGIDNVIFISILSAKLPQNQQQLVCLPPLLPVSCEVHLNQQ